jgi:hypothetical protein
VRLPPTRACTDNFTKDIAYVFMPGPIARVCNSSVLDMQPEARPTITTNTTRIVQQQ